MKRDFNLNLYQGNGLSISQRHQRLDEHEPLFDIDDPSMYISGKELRHAVNVALGLGQPLLITGEPGTGKTQLAASIAYDLELPEPLEFHTKTTSEATDLFYQYDAMRRFQDAQMSKETVLDVLDYITFRALGIAILLTKPPDQVERYLPERLRDGVPTRSVVLVDEIDKAPRDMPNDLLNEFEKMQFTVKETGTSFKADPRYPPILVLTSNSEKNLPDAFLRRCIFYHIPFPSDDQLTEIIQRRFRESPDFTPDFIAGAIKHFSLIRDLALRKKPATAELLAWIRVLRSLELDVNNPRKLPEAQAEKLAASYSILAKTYEDLALLKSEFLPDYGT